MKYVIKATGEKEPFIKENIENTVNKIGASKELAKKIANKIDKSFSKEISTKKILNHVLQLLRDNPKLASKYDLKRAIMSMGPAGFFFEEFIGQLLREYGYKTKTNKVFKGRVISQEVDVVAEKDNIWMIECKYHNKVGTTTNSKVVMYTHARFLDIKANKNNKINKDWLITNTKCTKSAIGYAKGAGLKITSWNYPKKESLQNFVENKELYPVTILRINKNTKQALLEGKIVFVRDILKYNLQQLKNKVKLSENVLRKLKKKANEVLY